jgi:hypothetical protein
MASIVVIEDSTVASMIMNQKLAESIPCLTNKKGLLGNVSNGCGSCARKRQQKVREEYAKIKSCLAAMSPEKKAELKKYLNAEQVRVVFANHGGKTVQMTF